MRLRHVALLRGLNVGGKNRLAMADLVGVFERAGCSEVRTYIQSGNVVFTVSAALVRTLAYTITDAVAHEFGLRVPVVLRTAEALALVVADSPFATADPAALHVMFLATAPSASAVAGLDPKQSPGDRFVVRGCEVYLHCPNGMARTKLTNDWFDRKLATTGTVRNWNTVMRLNALCGG